MHDQPSRSLTPTAGQQRGSPTTPCTRALLRLLQQPILSGCLQDRPNLLRPLDPSRDPRPEGSYRTSLAPRSVISSTRPACTEATPVTALVPAARRCTGATPFQARLRLTRAKASMASGKAALETPIGSRSAAQQRAAREGVLEQAQGHCVRCTHGTKICRSQLMRTRCSELLCSMGRSLPIGSPP